MNGAIMMIIQIQEVSSYLVVTGIYASTSMDV